MKNDDVVTALGAYMLLAMREAGEWFVKVEYRRNAIVYLYAAPNGLGEGYVDVVDAVRTALDRLGGRY